MNVATSAPELRVPVLMWHHVGAAPTRELAPYCIGTDMLQRQLDALQEAGYTAVTFDDLRAGARPPLPVVLSFDDGYRSFCDAAVPALSGRGMRAVCFVVAGQIGGVNDWDRGATDLGLMDEEEVADVVRRGHEIGAHGLRHRRMTELDRTQLGLELLASRAILESVTGSRVCTLSYPYGEASSDVARAAAASGFDVACLDWRAPGPDWPAGVGVTRIEVRPNTEPQQLLRWVTGNAASLSLRSGTASEAFSLLVESTLRQGLGHPPEVGWAVVHRASAPLMEALRYTEQVAPDDIFLRLIGSRRKEGRAVRDALAPVAEALDAQLRDVPRVPVWGEATPEDALAVEPQRVHVGPRWWDLARLLWDVPPARRDEVLGRYLRATHEPARRRHLRAARTEIATAETAMVAYDALEHAGGWPNVERSLRTVRLGESTPGRYVEAAPPITRRTRARRAAQALVRQRLRQEYSGSVLGFAWALGQPLVLYGTLALFFRHFLSLHIAHYPQFLVAAFVPWLFFQRSIGECIGSVRDSGDLLRLSAFPVRTLPMATIGAAAVDFAAQLIVMTPPLLITTGVSPVRLPVIVVAVAGLVTLTMITGLLVAGLAARFRDIGHAVPLLLTVAFYALPIVYDISRVPAHWRDYYWIDPLAVLLTLFRDALYGGAWPPAWTLLWTGGFCAAGLFAALRWFDSISDVLLAEV